MLSKIPMFIQQFNIFTNSPHTAMFMDAGMKNEWKIINITFISYFLFMRTYRLPFSTLQPMVFPKISNL